MFGLGEEYRVMKMKEIGWIGVVGVIGIVEVEYVWVVNS